MSMSRGAISISSSGSSVSLLSLPITSMGSIFDLLIAISYFCIPLQILVVLYRYPQLHTMPRSMFVLILLFVSFITFCGIGHLLRWHIHHHAIYIDTDVNDVNVNGTTITDCPDYVTVSSSQAHALAIVNTCTAIISVLTAIYLIPYGIPDLIHTIDDHIKQLQQAKEVQEEIATFNAFLVHEIRQPLFAISASLDFYDNDHYNNNNNSNSSNSNNLDSNNSDPTESSSANTNITSTDDVNECLSLIRKSSDHILHLLNNCVDFGKMQAGICNFDTRPYSVTDIVHNIDSVLQHQLLQKHQQQRRTGGTIGIGTLLTPPVRLECVVATTVPKQVIGDPARFQQIIYNLTSNSIKFTSRGTIHVSISTVPSIVAKRNKWILEPHVQTQPQKHQFLTNQIDKVSGCGSSSCSKHSIDQQHQQLQHDSDGSMVLVLPATNHNTTINTRTRLDTDDENDIELVSNLERGMLSSQQSSSYDGHSHQQQQSVSSTTNNQLRSLLQSKSPPISSYNKVSDNNKNNNSNTNTNCVIKVVISDTGCGIPNDRINEIFAPYRQAKMSTYKTAPTGGGSGLGLSIVSMLVKMMNGTIHVVSKEGTGTTFTVYLPVNAATAATTSSSATTTTAAHPTSVDIYRPNECAQQYNFDINNESATTCFLQKNNNDNDNSTTAQYNMIQSHLTRMAVTADVPTSTEHLVVTTDTSPLSVIPQKGDDTNQPSRTTIAMSSSPSCCIATTTTIINPLSRATPATITEVSGPESNASSSHSSTTGPTTNGTNLPSFCIATSASAAPRKSMKEESITSSVSTVATTCSLAEELTDPLTAVTSHTDNTCNGLSSSLPITSSKPMTDGTKVTKSKLKKFTIQTTETVLVVDDNEMNRKLIGRMLSTNNIMYDFAEDGQDAIDMILRSRNVNPTDMSKPMYGLIFMDWQMPVMGGCEATRLIRNVYNLSIPIVALTANAGYVFRDEALAVGCNEFATKPIRINELLNRCEKYLTQS